MKSKSIQIKTFLEFAAGFEDKLLTTKARHRKFRINVINGDLEVIPQSTGKPRKAPNKNIIRILDHYNSTNSLQSKDYHDITYNSVYVLTIIEEYFCINK